MAEFQLGYGGPEVQPRRTLVKKEFVLDPLIGVGPKLDTTDPELGYSYTFPKLELSFWRPDNDDEETPYCATVGLGRAGYYAPSGNK